MSTVGVVIPVFGRLDLLKQCCERLPKNYGVYLVDDCTPSAEESKAIKQFARDNHYRYFRNEQNMGFPATVNKGVSKSSENLVLILNTDVLMTPSAFDIMEEEMKNPEVGVIAPMLLFPQGTEFGPANKVQHVGVVFDINATPKHLFIGWDPNNPRVAKRRDTLQAVTGACMMFRRTTWKLIGGFALTYGRGTYEDMEFCILVRSFKMKVVCNPEAVGYHYVSQSAKSVGGYPLNQNRAIFMSRLGNVIKNDDYLYL